MYKLSLTIIVACMTLMISVPGFAACETTDACRQQYFDTTGNVQKSYLNYFNNLQLGSNLGGGRFQGKLARDLAAAGGSGGQLSPSGAAAGGAVLPGSQPQGNGSVSGIRYN